MLFNFPLEVAVISLLIAQFLKPIINYVSNREVDFSLLLSTGGMPSSHSAFVSSLALAMGLIHGPSSAEFAISFVLAGVVVHDAVGIRREAGRQATVLNEMRQDTEHLLRSLRNETGEKKEALTHLKELLGHEPIEAFNGVALGVAVTLLFYFL